MAIPLKQSTASQEVPLGPFVDDADGVTAMTALTIDNTDIKIWVTGATTLANKNSGGATHISGGIYYAVLDATDTATLGPLVIFVNESGALPVRVECVVLNANNYDSAIAGSDNLQVDAVQFAGQTITAAAGVTLPSSVASPTNITAASGITVSALGANVITAAATAADFDTAVAAAVLTAATATPIAANVEQINTVPIVGDGSGTPFNV